jgi:DNA polymerase-3 subunit beta
MKVRCDRGEMLEKLGVLAGVVPSISPKPILYDFLLRTSEGCLDVEATDLEMAGRVRVERVEVMEEGKLALPAAKLLSIVREIPDQAAGIFIERSGVEHSAGLNAEGYAFKLLGNDPEEFPHIGEVEVGKFLEVSREDFVRSLRRVAIAASRDPTRYQLGGVFFEVGEGKLTLTATDGKRLTNDMVRVEGDLQEQVEAIVPNRAVDAIVKMLHSPGTSSLEERFFLGFTHTDLVVKTGSSQLHAKLIEGKYPNYRNALPASARVKVKVKRNELLSAARSAQLMTDEKTSTVIFRFGEGGLVIWSQAKDVGETRIEVKAEVEQGPLEIRFNPGYLIDALRAIDDEEVRIELQDSDRPGVLRGGSHYRHMVMPLVLEKA